MIRLLPFASADGATNMAADEALGQSAAAGVASLRFYGWTTATVSLGYFQPHAAVHTDPRLHNLSWVRRPSGGATLVHHHELTYALALPAGAPWQTGASWLLRMHRIITAALIESGLGGTIALVENPSKHGDLLCFQQSTVGDVHCGGRKIVGSAQRKYRQALLQHGSILLAQSEHTPALPGIRELTGVTLDVRDVVVAVTHAFVAQTGWNVQATDWTAEEQAYVKRLAVERYVNGEWNRRR